ncbi:MAG TPA: DUF2806 domain-containing protein [Allosphingosinicella sp.]|nr:DUF2806 domain-containing protein [Allosphingosinicella sp.]
MGDEHESRGAQAVADRIGRNLLALPDPIQTGFWKAAGRLVGGALATPGAWLRRPAQSIEDKTDASSLVTRRVAEAAAERAAADPEIVERAMESLLREEFRKQSNKERVIDAAAEELTRDPDSAPHDETATEVDDDWMNVFVRYAEDASSERMQSLWGRVLAGKIRNQSCYSLRTIRFLSELDTEIAREFERIAPCVINDFMLYDKDRDSSLFREFLKLEDAGLLNVGTGLLSKSYTIPKEGRCHLIGNEYGLELEAGPGYKFSIPIIAVTLLGCEILTLIKLRDEQASLKKIVAYLLSKHEANFAKISLGKLITRNGNTFFHQMAVLHQRSSGGD